MCVCVCIYIYKGGGTHYQCAYMFSTSSSVKMVVKNVSK